MKNIPGEKVTAIKKTVATQNGKVEFDKKLNIKELAAISAHGSHRNHSSS